MKDGKFEVGDMVECINADDTYRQLEVGEIYEVDKEEYLIDCSHIGLKGMVWYWMAKRFKYAFPAALGQKNKAFLIGQFMLWKAIELKCPEYCTTEDLEEINSWDEEASNNIIDELQKDGWTSDFNNCPFCLLYKKIRKNKCSSCGWGRRHGRCETYDSLYHGGISNMIGQEKIKAKIKKLFPVAIPKEPVRVIPNQFKDGDRIIMKNEDKWIVKNIYSNCWALLKGRIMLGNILIQRSNSINLVLDTENTIRSSYIFRYFEIKEENIERVV